MVYVAASFSFQAEGGTALAVLLALALLPFLARYLVRYLAFRSRLRQLKQNNVVVTQYNAPPDIPAAFFGIIVDNRQSVQDFIATKLALVQRGILIMHKDGDSQDYLISRDESKPLDHLLPHERYTAELYGATPRPAKPPLGNSDPSLDAMAQYVRFNFMLLQDLQRAGYYHFDANMQQLTAAQYTAGFMRRALTRGLMKPWNWPGFVISAFFPPFGFVWGLVALVYYNRVGLYRYRTPQWEQAWPAVAGYYNYLRVVEAQRRNFALSHPGSSTDVTVHDPYLTAAQLQKFWSDKFYTGIEIGAGGQDYNTMQFSK